MTLDNIKSDSTVGEVDPPRLCAQQVVSKGHGEESANMRNSGGGYFLMQGDWPALNYYEQG